MYLKKLHIQNFRCFEDYTIEFAPRVTILFGKNGSGKSTVIHAMHKSLSFIFDKKLIKENEYDLGAAFGIKVEDFNDADTKRNWKTGMLFPYMSICAEGSFNDMTLPEWEMYSSTTLKTKTPQPSKYKEAYLSLMQHVGKTNVLPFVAYYSDSFPHIPKTKPLSEKAWSLRNVGYVDWNEESACSELWITRLEMTWKQWNRENNKVLSAENSLRNCDAFLKQGILTREQYDEDVRMHTENMQRAIEEREKFEPEVNAIVSCLVKFSKGDPNFEIRDVFENIYVEKLCLYTTQGENNPLFHDLPAGYKRIYYMVLDIAYRSYLLNKTTDARGIAIIDEIDLHLHPEFEKTVLPRLMNTFPNLQFVVSTHSIHVLTGLSTVGGENFILLMSPESHKPYKFHNIYGLDCNSGIEEVMGVRASDSELDHLISRVAYMRKKGYNEAASNLKKCITDKKVLDEDEIEIRIKKEMHK